MSKDEINYHSTLKSVANVYDPPIALMRYHVQNEPTLYKWPVHLFLLQIKDIKRLTGVFKSFKNINFSALPIIGSIMAPIITALTLEVNSLVLVGSSIGLYIILFLCGMPYYFMKMLSITEKNDFHIGAYRKFRSTEYEMFSIFLGNNTITFQGLYDYVTGILTKQESELEIVKAVTNQFNQEKAELKRENKELRTEKEEKEQSIVDHYDKLVNELNEEMGATELGLKYLIELLADINNVLYRIVNNCLWYSDLKILSGITLYRLDEDVLYKEADEGTSGNSPEKISINDEKYKHYAMVTAVKSEIESPKKNEPREGYFIISHKMKMKKNEYDTDTWIINFHVNKELNNKAWQLILNHDIISNKEVYRIFHALCLFLYTNTGTKMEVVDDASS